VYGVAYLEFIPEQMQIKRKRKEVVYTARIIYYTYRTASRITALNKTQND
jgi:hypothetical protein